MLPTAKTIAFIYSLVYYKLACYGPEPTLEINTRRSVPALQGSPGLVRESLGKGTEGRDWIIIGAFI